MNEIDLINFLTEASKNNKKYVAETIESISRMKEALEKTSDKNCSKCINKGKCAIHDNFNIDYCSGWSVEEC